MKTRSIKNQAIIYGVILLIAYLGFIGLYALFALPKVEQVQPINYQNEISDEEYSSENSAEKRSIIDDETNMEESLPMVMMAPESDAEPEYPVQNQIREPGIFVFGTLMSLIFGGILIIGYRRFVLPVYELGKNISQDSSTPLVFKNDATELEIIKASFNNINAKLNTALNYQKRFNASMAHELKTPLSIIKTHIDVLDDMEDKQIEDYENALSLIRKTVNKMNALVETLLDTSHQGSENLNDEIQYDELIDDVLADLHPLAEEKEIELISEGRTSSSNHGNQVLLYRMMYNMIENSIKYNHSGGKVIVKLNEDAKGYYLSVSDTGFGIDQADLEHIFEPFYRSKTLQKDGMGLGLSLVQSVVYIHSGQIQVSSKLGAGSSFDIFLPKLSQGGQIQ